MHNGWNFKQLGRLLTYQYNAQGCLFYNKKPIKRQQMETNQIRAVTDGHTLQIFSCQTPWDRMKNAFI